MKHRSHTLQPFSLEDLAEAKLALEELGEEGSKEYNDIVIEMDRRISEVK